jgi:nucleotide-binding universal stress UspA family protein
MTELSKILVPVDFSEHSERALVYAKELARAFGARLHLTHVYPPTAYITPQMTPAPVLMPDFREQTQKAFEEYLARARRDYDVPLTGTLAEGTPHVEIVRVAKEIGADLIVMGTHGRSGLEHLLIGSVAERVIRGSDVPVITVPRPDAQTAVETMNV